MAVQRSELGKRTKTTSPRRGLIMDGGFRSIPVFGESFQPGAEISSLGFANPPGRRVHDGFLGSRLAQDRVKLRLQDFDPRLEIGGPLELFFAQTIEGLPGFRCTHSQSIMGQEAVVRLEIRFFPKRKPADGPPIANRRDGRPEDFRDWASMRRGRRRRFGEFRPERRGRCLRG